MVAGVESRKLALGARCAVLDALRFVEFKAQLDHTSCGLSVREDHEHDHGLAHTVCGIRHDESGKHPMCQMFLRCQLL